DHGEGTRAHLAGELADRGQPRSRCQLPVAHELRDALADLIDERDLGIADELEHRPPPSGSAYRTIMTAVAPSASALATLNAVRPRGAPRKLFSEVPKSAHTIMHGTPIPSMTPAM